MPVIYIDVLIAINVYIDFLLLKATARLLRLPHKTWRLALSSFVGAISCCTVLIPSLQGVLLVAIKVAVAAVMVWIAFGWEGMGPYIKQLVVLFVISTAFAGVATALWAFAAPQGFYVIGGVVYYDISPLLLAGLTAISYLLIRLYDRFIRKREPLGREYRLQIEMDGKAVEVKALYDSGNHLTEPFSGQPVAIITYGAAAKILPPRWLIAVTSAWNQDVPPPDTAVSAGLRIVAYQALGGSGLLYAFKPSRLTILGQDGERDATGAYVAVCDSLGQGDYQALIGTDLLSGKFIAERREQPV